MPPEIRLLQQTYPAPLVYQVPLGSWDASLVGLGTWTLSINHMYDIARQRLYLGDGTVRNVAADPYAGSEYAITNADGSELYLFDSNGRHLQTLETINGITKFTFTYDSSGRLASVVDAYGKVTSITRNLFGTLTGIQAPHGQATSLGVDTNGNLASITNPNSETYSMTYYSAAGLLQTFQKPGGQVTNFTYDALGALTQDSTAGAYLNFTSTGKEDNKTVQMTTALGRVTQFGIMNDPASANFVRTQTDPDSRYSQFTFDPRNILVFRDKDRTSVQQHLAPDARFGWMAPFVYNEITIGGFGAVNINSTSAQSLPNASPTPSPGEYQEAGSGGVSTSYPSGGLGIPGIPGTPTPTPPKTFSDYFGYATLPQTTTLGGLNATSVFDKASSTQTNTSFDGRITKTTVDLMSRLASVQIANYQPTSFSYDTEGRLSQISQLGRNAYVTYNSLGYISSIQDPKSLTTQFTYDNAGRVLTTTLPDGVHIINYSYDANGKLASVTPANTFAHTFTYNDLGSVSSYMAPALTSSIATQYTYDLDRSLTQITEPSGATIAYGYDPTSGILNTITTGLGTNSYSFFQGDLNRPSYVSTFDGATYSADYSSILLQDFQQGGTVKGSMTFTYDSHTRLTSLQMAGTSAADPITITSDDDSFLLTVGDETITRDSVSGFLTGDTLSSIAETYSYDTSYGELNASTATYSGTNLLSENIARTLSGQIATKTETIQATANTYTYTYDNLGRLIQVNLGSAVQSVYAYDANSNRLSATLGTAATVYATYNHDDQLVTYGSNTYAYNLDGFLSSITNGTLLTTYNYDVLGNLRGVSIPAQGSTPAKSITYIIDGFNRRVGKSLNGTLQQMFLYQNQTQVAAELTSTGDILSEFLYGTKSNVPDYMIRGGATYKIISDNLGSPHFIVDSDTGVIAEQITYDEFGNVVTDTNPGFQPFGFAGGLYDPDTKLVRFGARDYDPETGRFISKDPLLFGGGSTNLYSYTLNDPINFVDPSGDFAIEIGAGFLTQIGLLGGGASKSLAFSFNFSTGLWQVGTTTSVQGNVGGGLYGGGGLQATISPFAGSLCSLEGSSVGVGGAAGTGLAGGSAQLTVGSGGPSLTLSGLPYTGAGAGVAGYGVYSNTSVNITNQGNAYSWLKSALGF